MELTIKNLKIADFASHETLCYECSVYIDGKRAFIASNDGKGGCDSYHAVNNEGRMLLNFAQEYAKSLPPVAGPFDDTAMNMDLDLLMSELITLEHVSRRLRRDLKSKTCILENPAHTSGEYRYYRIAYCDKAREHVLKQYPNAIILNEIPFNQAVALVY